MALDLDAKEDGKQEGAVGEAKEAESEEEVVEEESDIELERVSNAVDVEEAAAQLLMNEEKEEVLGIAAGPGDGEEKDKEEGIGEGESGNEGAVAEAGFSEETSGFQREEVADGVSLEAKNADEARLGEKEVVDQVAPEDEAAAAMAAATAEILNEREEEEGHNELEAVVDPEEEETAGVSEQEAKAAEEEAEAKAAEDEAAAPSPEKEDLPGESKVETDLETADIELAVALLLSEEDAAAERAPTEDCCHAPAALPFCKAEADAPSRSPSAGRGVAAGPMASEAPGQASDPETCGEASDSELREKSFGGEPNGVFAATEAALAEGAGRDPKCLLEAGVAVGKDSVLPCAAISLGGEGGVLRLSTGEGSDEGDLELSFKE